jgi:hypothetical protein
MRHSSYIGASCKSNGVSEVQDAEQVADLGLQPQLALFLGGDDVDAQSCAVDEERVAAGAQVLRGLGRGDDRAGGLQQDLTLRRALARAVSRAAEVQVARSLSAESVGEGRPSLLHPRPGRSRYFRPIASQAARYVAVQIWSTV